MRSGLFSLAMTDSDEKIIDKLEKLLAKSKFDKAFKLADTLAVQYMQEGLYLKAVVLWKAILKADPERIAAHLRLIALQDELDLQADAQVQRRILDDICRKQKISAEQLKHMQLQLEKESPKVQGSHASPDLAVAQSQKKGDPET